MVAVRPGTGTAMTSTARTLALTLSAAALVAVPAASGAAAPTGAPQRAGQSFGVIKTWYGAKQQACKTSVAGGKKWRVSTRVVNGRRAEVGVGLIVYRDGEEQRRVDTKIVRTGATSKVVSLLYPKQDDDFELVAIQFQGQAGNGGPVKITKIRAC